MFFLPALEHRRRANGGSICSQRASWRSLPFASGFPRGVRWPLAALLFFIATLFPVLGFLNVYPFIYSYVADHFAHLRLVSLSLFRSPPRHPALLLG